MRWNIIAFIFQLSFTLWFALTHWVSLPPLNHLEKEAFSYERKINLILHFFQILSLTGFLFSIRFLMWVGLVFWTLSLAGHIVSWWLPYFWGWPKPFLENALEDNGKTFHFLPPRKNHPIPDANHCVIGVLVLLATISTYIALF